MKRISLILVAAVVGLTGMNIEPASSTPVRNARNKCTFE